VLHREVSKTHASAKKMKEGSTRQNGEATPTEESDYEITGHQGPIIGKSHCQAGWVLTQEI